MELYQRLEQIIVTLRPAFSRERPFEWFVLLVWGVILSTQPPAVSSYLNALGLSENYYHRALHWFASSAFTVDELCYRWGVWLRTHAYQKRLRAQRVYVGDGIKVSKEGRKMPGVKGLHQESENMGKPEWIRGHYFSALAQVLGVGQALFATPIVLKLHDGIAPVTAASEPLTLVDKMAHLCVHYVVEGSYVLLDAYYASEKILTPFRAHGVHLISRARISTVGYAAFSRRPGKHGPGRHRKWGAPVKLRELFAPVETCLKTSVWLYGQTMTVYYQSITLYWDSPDELVLFVLTQLPSGKQIILLSSDINLSAQEVIEAYGWRFKIEVSFRTLVHLLGGFSYQFWLKAMTRISRWPENLCLADYEKKVQAQIMAKVEAFERFVNLNAIALGLLQVLALEFPAQVWLQFPRWFRTYPKQGYPSEQIVRRVLQHQPLAIFSKSTPTLLLEKLLVDKIKTSQPLEPPELVT